MSRILLPINRHVQPQGLLTIDGQWGLTPAFIWCGSSPLINPYSNGSGWNRSTPVIDTTINYGKASIFDGTVNGYTCPAGITAAQTSVTFIAIYTRISSVNGQVLISTSSVNSGFRLNQAGASLFFTKGGVANVGAGIGLVSNVPYIVICSNDQGSGAYYLLVKPLFGGVISRDVNTTNATAVSNGANGTYCVGRGHVGWNGSVGLGFASFDYFPEQAARELIRNPWKLFSPILRKIYASIAEAPPDSAPIAHSAP